MEIILAAFATYRLASLLVEEDGPFRIFAKLRERVVIRIIGGKESGLADNLHGLINCRACMGIWMAALCTALLLADGKVGNTFLLIFGIAGAQAFLSRHDG